MKRSRARSAALKKRNKTRRQRQKMRGGSVEAGAGAAAAPGNVYVYYHIFCNPLTLSVMKDQIIKILFSGLYDRAAEIRCCVTGEAKLVKEASKLLKESGAKFKILAEAPDDKTFEKITLNKIRETIQPEDRFLYFHTKGVTRKEHEQESIFFWRTWMEYCLIRHYERCLEVLEDHDIVGAQYLANWGGAPPHFSGNFWWSTGKYFLSLPTDIGPDYYDSEFYIFKGKPKFYEIGKAARSKHDMLYGVRLTPSEYVDKTIE